MTPVIVILGWLMGAEVVYLAVQRWGMRDQLRKRLLQRGGEAETVGIAQPERRLTRWLALAGYRGPGAAMSFVALTLLGLCVGTLAGVMLAGSGLLRQGVVALERFPGGVGEIFLPLAYLAPWLVAVGLSAAPWLVVRAARRRRVAQIEEDLPLILELLATLGEAGLGFDGALQRILTAQAADRPLAMELRAFHVDLLAGRGRVASLRRLARRVEVMAVSLLTSALAQAEQTGSGVAGVLRRQADDLRSRRREDAMAFAQGLPVKLLFPLVICFLPGLFVATLGPTFYQFFQYADTLLRSR